MQAVPETSVVPSWNDPKYQGAILAKGQRAARPIKPVAVVEKVIHKLCDNCGKPVSMAAFDRCQCSIWDVGKRP